MIPILLTVVLFAQLAPSSSAALHFQAGLVRSKQAEPDRDRHRGIQQAISLEPSNPASYVELGQAYMKASRYGEAVPVLNRALELDPDLLYYLGQASHIFWREPLASSAPTLPSPP